MFKQKFQRLLLLDYKTSSPYGNHPEKTSVKQSTRTQLNQRMVLEAPDSTTQSSCIFNSARLLMLTETVLSVILLQALSE
jgi:hypothetical protein